MPLASLSVQSTTTTLTYRIDLATGEGGDRDGGSKGLKHRVHEVREREGQVEVKLCLDKEEVASDHYAEMGLYKVAATSCHP